MGARAAILAAVGAVVAAGCSHAPYQCTTSAQCVADGVAGTCQPLGFCSFPDPACDSGERYEADAGNDLGGTCVGTQPACGAIGGACCEGATPCLDNLFCAAGTCQQCATEIATGHFHTCALRYDGTVWCAGENEEGELGIGAIGGLPSAEWSQVRDDTNAVITDATMIGASGHTTCVKRSSDDALWCWGDNEYFQIGNNASSSSNDEPAAVRVEKADGSPLTDIVEADGGHDHICARDGSGGVWCWGHANNGRLGVGTPASPDQGHAIPVLVADMGAAFTGATALAVGEAHACVTRGSELWCWGLNTAGQVGDATTSDQLVPVRIPGFEVASVAAGRFHTCAAKPDGTLWCWGQGHQARLGNGTGDRTEGSNLDRTTPTQAVTILGGAPFGNVAKVAAAAVSCAVTNDQRAYCWGINPYGQTGTGVGSYVPRAVLNQDGTPLRGVDRMVAKFTRTCAWLTTGELRCWGRNSEGALGDGTFDNIGYAKPVKLTCP